MRRRRMPTGSRARKAAWAPLALALVALALLAAPAAAAPGAAPPRLKPGDILVLVGRGTTGEAGGADVIRVDPKTGRRSVWAKGVIPESLIPTGLALAADRAIYVAGRSAPGGRSSIVRIDPRTGAQRQIAGNLGVPGDVEVGPDGKLYVVEQSIQGGSSARPTGVLRIDPRTGRKTVFASFPYTVTVNDIAFGKDELGKDAVYVALGDKNAPGGGLVYVSLGTRTQKPLTSGLPLPNPSTIAAHPSLGLFFVNAFSPVGSVDRAVRRFDGDAWPSVTAGGSLLDDPSDLAFEPGGTLLLANRGRTGTGAEAGSGVLRIDPKTGKQTKLATGGLVTNPAALAVVT